MTGGRVVNVSNGRDANHMMLKVDVETVDSLRRRLAVEVPAEAVSAEIEKAYGNLGRAAKVPGFRPGRVPRPVLERMFGDRVRADVFARLIQDSYLEALEEQHIDAVGQPEIVTEQAQIGTPLRYSATVEVKPDVTVDNYRGLHVERPIHAVTDAEIDASVEQLRQSLAQLHPVTDRSEVSSGDVVTIDYEGHIDGRVAGRAEGRTVEVGANGFPCEFDAALIGASVGAELRFNATYPEDRGGPELAGKTVAFHVRVRGISRKELPELDDEFAKDHGECDTLAELRARLRRQLEADAARRADEAVRRRLVDELVKAHDIPVPQAMVQRRTEVLVEEVTHEWRQRRIWPRDEQTALANLRNELEPRACEQVKIGFLLEAIARQESIHINDSELDMRIEEYAGEAGSAAERVRALYQNPDARRQLHARLSQSRALDVVVAHASITDVPETVNVADLGENG